MARRSRIPWFVLSTCLIGATMQAAPTRGPAHPIQTVNEIEAGQIPTGTSGSLGGAEPGVLIVFVRTGCPHCADAKAFLADYVRDLPSLRVVYRPVDEDPSAAADLVSLYEDLMREGSPRDPDQPSSA